MKKIVFIAFLAISNFISAQDKLNQFDDKGLRHGLWKGYHDESKRPRYEGTLDHGKETGTFKYFDEYPFELLLEKLESFYKTIS